VENKYARPFFPKRNAEEQIDLRKILETLDTS